MAKNNRISTAHRKKLYIITKAAIPSIHLVSALTGFTFVATYNTSILKIIDIVLNIFDLLKLVFVEFNIFAKLAGNCKTKEFLQLQNYTAGNCLFTQNL